MIIYFANHITYLPFGSQENRNVHKIHRSALSSYSLVVIIVLTRTNMAADGRLLLISLFSLFCGEALKPSIGHLKRVHTGERTFNAVSVTRISYNIAILLNHMRVHTGEKPYQCRQCDKAFSQNRHIITYVTIHTGEKPYPCSQCNKTFL